MALNKIAEKKWSYTLYESAGTYVLSVLCGNLALYELNIPLAPGDAEKAIRNNAYLDKLASEIAGNRTNFLRRALTSHFFSFTRPGWRNL